MYSVQLLCVFIIVPFIYSVELICFQDLIELYFPACSDVEDLRLAMASLGFSATQQEEDKKGGFGGRKNSQRIKNKSTGGSTSSLSEPRRLNGQWS